ncbi:LacI family DNA-binding transcriptional regulator [Paenibacillus methanolicus]|uniref:LacI family transcriptional regulator/LacI family purine nucleotide synthesis repressor n=1 Tax=Paenibacillus methanolicus TaxID=582686 RepID=A0A5S5C5A3_9BACL|nr:LacI family DNA-binding transcriptional regulator [Paenibacillus methanolicus]TYP74514.1 LacI family transcriptional regulator/LacI family purine nucleotide synthesis repressor [Paenibacillus methanolicus]
MKNITIYDIAKEADVSVTTVSRVLNGTAPVKASTKEAVLRVIEKHKFQPNALARSLIKKETGTIAMIVPDITNPFFPEVFWGSENEAREKGYTFFLCNSAGEYGRESEYLSILREKRVEGIIFVGGRINLANCPPELVQEVVDTAKGIPVVLVNGHLAKSQLHRVYTDEAAGAALAAQHVIDLGHREIAFIGGMEELTTTIQKVKAVKRKLEEHGLGLRKDRLLFGEFSITAGRELMAKLLEQADRPTAVICVNDFTAIGAIKAATERGLRIPDDISIVGFDDSPLSTAVIPELTTVTQNTNELGKLAVERIYQINNGLPAKRSTVLQPKLVVRQSTGRAPGMA